MLQAREAQRFVDKPGAYDTTFPFAERYIKKPTADGKRKAEEPVVNPKGRKRFAIPCHCINEQKFCPKVNTTELISPDVKSILPAEMQNEKWCKLGTDLFASALAKNTWNKYAASLKKFKLFCHELNIGFSWPLSEKNLIGFVVWCKNKNCISPKSVKSYLFGLSKLQQLNGFQPIKLSRSLLSFVLDGWFNSYNKKQPESRPLALHDLEILQAKFMKMFHHKVDSMAYTTAAVLAFFGSFRISEILAVSKEKFDKFSTLRWKDVKIGSNQVIIKIKKPKCSKSPEEVFLFTFKNKKICPVNCIKKLLDYQKRKGLWDESKPVFRLNSGFNLTKFAFNKVVKKACNISGHKFRSAIPSIMANNPKIWDDSHVMGWGRWKSKTFIDYQKSKGPQKKWVFRKIEKILT
jgi:hypothetical protein